jgi:hypothetical protein
MPAVLAAHMSNEEWTNFCNDINKKLEMLMCLKYLQRYKDISMVLWVGTVIFDSNLVFIAFLILFFISNLIAIKSSLFEDTEMVFNITIGEGSKECIFRMIQITWKEYIIFSISQKEEVPSTTTDTNQDVMDFSIPATTQKHQSMFDAMSQDLDSQMGKTGALLGMKTGTSRSIIPMEIAKSEHELVEHQEIQQEEELHRVV